MDSDSSFPISSNFGFAFNNINFSDRILNIHIIPHGDEAFPDNDPQVVIVKTIHISSPILAAKSPFFYKMFCNGMRESEQRHAILRIHASEEAPLIDLLNYMYKSILSASKPRELLHVLMAADKFEVASCMQLCSKLLQNFPMTLESASLYLDLDLPPSLSLAKAVQPLIHSAKQFLISQYKDLTKYNDEVLKFPLAAIEVLFSSDDLQVYCEDDVYDFLLKWAIQHYPKLEDQRKVFGSRLGSLVRFPYMTHLKLMQFFCSKDCFKPQFDASEAVANALFVKAKLPYGRTSRHGGFVERDYKLIPIKVVSFESPHQQCVVYLDLKREECLQLFPSQEVFTQSFHLGGQVFCLVARCRAREQGPRHWFDLLLGMYKRESTCFSLDYEFSARAKPTGNYVSKGQGNYVSTTSIDVGYCVPWTEFVSEDSFIDDILHIRAELTFKQPVVAG